MIVMEATPRLAARLVYKGLQPKLVPVNDKEYRDLIALYEGQPEFRRMVDEVAIGLELSTLSVGPSGAVFMPASADSRFAIRLTDIKAGMSVEEKAQMVLVHVAIAAMFYPTAEKLNDDSYDAPPVSEADTVSALKAICQEFSRRSGEQSAHSLPKELEPGWQSILAKPESRPEQLRKTSSTLDGLVAGVFKQLQDNGLVRLDSDEGSPRYTTAWRYTVQLRELIVNVVFQAAREALAHRESADA